MMGLAAWSFSTNLKISQERKAVLPGNSASHGLWLRAVGRKIGMAAFLSYMLLTNGTPDDFIPIPGTKSIEYIEDNFKSNEVHITAKDDEEIRAVIKTIDVSGDRAPPQIMQSLNA